MNMVNVVLDMKGLSCPKPLLGAKRMVDELAPGQVLLLISDCQGTPDDLFAWAELTGNQIIKSEKQADGSTGYHIQKGSNTSRPAAHVSLDIRGSVCPGPIVEANTWRREADGRLVLMAQGQAIAPPGLRLRDCLPTVP